MSGSQDALPKHLAIGDLDPAMKAEGEEEVRWAQKGAAKRHGGARGDLVPQGGMEAALPLDPLRLGAVL